MSVSMWFFSFVLLCFQFVLLVHILQLQYELVVCSFNLGRLVTY
ncbi:unnamed protein product [Arabidopsis halleri]